MYAPCTQTWWDEAGHHEIPPDTNAGLTCMFITIEPSQRIGLRKISPAHNPEVAGSNPAPATSEVAGQRPFRSVEREGL